MANSLGEITRSPSAKEDGIDLKVSTFTAQQNEALVDLLWPYMRKDKEHPDRVQTSWGTKTRFGLCACIERIARGE